MQLRRYLLFFLCFAGLPAFGQSKSVTTLNAANQCAQIGIGTASTVAIQVTGTFSATLQPEVSVQGQAPANAQTTPSTSTTAQNTITTTGVYRTAVGGYDTFLLCVSSYVSGSATVYLNASSGVNAGLLGGGGGGGTVTSVSGTANQIDVANGTTTPVISFDPAAMIDTGATFTPANLGQITSTGGWFPIAPSYMVPAAPTLTSHTTGGSLANSTGVYVRLTFDGISPVQASGEVQTSPALASCTGGNQCSVTVNMPTPCTAGNLPAGVTGCSVWYGINASNTEQKFASCTNITTSTCSILANPSGGASISTVLNNIGGTLPPGAPTSLQSNHIIPVSYIQKADLNYYPLFGIDASALNNAFPHGLFTLLQPMAYNDAGASSDSGIQSTGGITINHQEGHNENPNCSVSNLCIDTAFTIAHKDSLGTQHDWEQSLAMYAERQFSDNSLTCTPTGGEVCVGTIRGNITDTRTGGDTVGSGSGIVAISGFVQNSQGNGGHGITRGGYVAGSFLAADGTTAVYNEGAQAYIGVAAQTSGNNGGQGFNEIGYNIKSSRGSSFDLGNYGLWISGFSPSRNIDYAMLVDGGPAFFGGNAEAPIYLDSLTTNHSTIAVLGSLGVKGDYGSTAFTPNANLAAVGHGGATGATTYTYNGACVGADGTIAMYTNPATTATGNADLTATNYNVLLTGPPNGCTSINWYRTVAGGTCNGGACGTGYIGTTAIPQTASVAGLPPVATVGFNDTGIVATGGSTVAPGNSNNTGSIVAAGYVYGALNSVHVCSAGGTGCSATPGNFTTANNTNLQTITGLTWNLYKTAAITVSFACDLSYSQATGNDVVAFGIQAATNAPTNIYATGTEQLSTTAGVSTYASGTLATLASTTATNIVSGTPLATATNYTVHLAGTIELAANTYDAVSLMVSTATGADAVTVLRGSSCYQMP